MQQSTNQQSPLALPRLTPTPQLSRSFVRAFLYFPPIPGCIPFRPFHLILIAASLHTACITTNQRTYDRVWGYGRGYISYLNRWPSANVNLCSDRDCVVSLTVAYKTQLACRVLIFLFFGTSYF
jgi:hypothetical protein